MLLCVRDMQNNAEALFKEEMKKISEGLRFRVAIRNVLERDQVDKRDWPAIFVFQKSHTSAVDAIHPGANDSC